MKVDINNLMKLAEEATPGERSWYVEDASMAILCADHNPIEKSILSISPCNACIEGQDSWKWGRCTTPSVADAKFVEACDPAIIKALCEVVVKAQRIEQMCVGGENAIDRFDLVAEMFRKDTGMMRPGKDVAAGSGMDDDYAVRQDAFDRWWKAQWAKLSEALSPFQESGQ